MSYAPRCVRVRSLLLRVFVSAGGMLMAGACGDSPASPSPGPGNQDLISISSTGIVSPKELAVSAGARVLFVNNHSRAHHMASDPHPDHLDCPELNQVGLLNPGQSRETGNLLTVRTCGFHDHDDPGNVNLRGTIVIR
jgi:plastocyanin